MWESGILADRFPELHRTRINEEASMIRKNLVGIGLIVAGLVSTAVWAQTVDELIEKNIQAKGGREKIQAIKTLRLTGKRAMSQGTQSMEVPFTLEMARPDKMRVEFVVQGMTGIQTYDGKQGWMVMPFMGKTDPEPIADKQLEALQEQADFDGPLMDYKTKGHQVELVGREDLEGTPAWKLKITKKNGDLGYYWLDAETFLDLKASGKTNVNGQDIEGESWFGDYKETGGVLFAHSVENKVVGMPGSATITIDKVEVNPDLPADRFGKPQPAKKAQ
jgi:outer membrane lipoprotein-sorting protein